MPADNSFGCLWRGVGSVRLYIIQKSNDNNTRIPCISFFPALGNFRLHSSFGHIVSVEMSAPSARAYRIIAYRVLPSQSFLYTDILYGTPMCTTLALEFVKSEIGTRHVES